MADRHRPSRGEAEIGPNAVLQTVRVIEDRLGPEVSAAILAEAGLSGLPSGESMIREAHAIALHRAIARRLPREAAAIARSAGWRTADYIMEHRIPGPVRALLRFLPAPLSARLLMAAIRRHAWTFIGAGRFTIHSPWSFTISRESAGDDTHPPSSLFEWYGAVFTRLFRELVGRDCECRASMTAPGHEALVHSYRIARGGLPETLRPGGDPALPTRRPSMSAGSPARRG